MLHVFIQKQKAKSLKQELCVACSRICLLSAYCWLSWLGFLQRISKIQHVMLYPFFVVGWLELLKLFFVSRMQGRSSARFWLRPRWSWTNWWRRSARLWTSPSLTGRHAGWPDRSVNSSWRERETGFKSFWTCSLQVLCRAPCPLCSQEPRND